MYQSELQENIYMIAQLSLEHVDVASYSFALSIESLEGPKLTPHDNTHNQGKILVSNIKKRNQGDF